MADNHVEGYGVVYAIKPQFTCGFLSPLSGTPANVHFKLSPDVLRPEDWGTSQPRQNQHVWFSATKSGHFHSHAGQSNTPWTCIVVTPAVPVEGVFTKETDGSMHIKYKDQLYAVIEESWPAPTVQPTVKHQDPEPGDHALFLSGDGIAYDVRIKAGATVKEVNINTERAYMYLDWIRKKNTAVFYWFRSKEEAKFWKKGMRAYFEPYNFRKEGETSWRLQGRCAVYSALAKVTSLPEDNKLGSLDLKIGAETKSFKFDASVVRHTSRVKAGHAVFFNIGTEETKEFTFGVLDVWPIGKGTFQSDGVINDLETKSEIFCDYTSALGGARLLPGDHVEYFLEEDKTDGSTWAVSVRLCGPLVGTVKERASATRALYKVTLHPDQRQILVLFSNQTVAPKQDMEISMFWDFSMEEYVAKDVKKLSSLPPVPKSQPITKQPRKLSSSIEMSLPSSPSEPTSPILSPSSSSLRSSSSSLGTAASAPRTTQAPISPPLSHVATPSLQETARPILTQLVAKLVPTGAARITEILLETHKLDEEILRLVQDPHYLTVHTTEAMKIYEAELRRQISAAELLAASSSMNNQRSTSAPANLFNVSSFPPAMQSIAAQMLAQQAAQAGMAPEAFVKNLIMQNIQPQQHTSRPAPAPPSFLGGLPGLVPPFQQTSQQPMGSTLFGMPAMPGMSGMSGSSFSPLLYQQTAPSTSDDLAPSAPPADVPQRIDQETSYYPQKLLHQSSISKTYEGIRRHGNSPPQRVCVRVYEPGLVDADAVPEMIDFAKQHHHRSLPEFRSQPLIVGKSVAVAMDWYPTTLRSYLDSNKQFMSHGKRREIALQLLLAVEILHVNDQVCRDINPDCIFIHDDRLILCDYGLPRIDDQSSFSIYAAPEIAGGRIGPAQDMFALGCCLGHILGGQHPLVDPNNDGTIAEHLLSGTMPGIQQLEHSSPLAYSLISQLVNADDDQRPTILTVSEHMFFWTSAQYEALINRIFLLVSRDSGFDDILVEASADVIPVGDAGDFSWRSHIDDVLLDAIDAKLLKEGVDADDSLVGLIFGFKAALDSSESWPLSLRQKFKSQDSKQDICAYFVNQFPRIFAVVQQKAAERKAQLTQLLPLFDLDTLGDSM